MSHAVFDSLQSLLHGQEVAAQHKALPEWSDLGEMLIAIPLPPANNIAPAVVAPASVAAPGTNGGGPSALAGRLGPHPFPQSAGVGVAGHPTGLLASSLDTGLSLTPLPADRVATTIIFKSGVTSLTGDRPDDIEERTAAKANAILTGQYHGEGDGVIN